jgi:peptidoglycan/LPS O-acetylase OafA/YrhL
MDYRREVDGLRAFAVLPVMLFHAGFQGFSGGFVGVDVFFVISGYLITSIIIAELDRGTFSIANFYERRARRILPALFLVMICCIPAAWIYLLPIDMKDFVQSVMAVSLFSSNILFWSESGYFDTASELKPLLHTWSLAVEEQFYVIFPLLLMLLWRSGRKRVLMALGVLLAISLAVAQWAATAQPSAAFFLLPMRGWELLVGALAAFHLSRRDRPLLPIWVREAGGWLGLGLIGWSILVFDQTTPWPGVFALAPTIGAVLIILTADGGTRIGQFLGNRLFVGIGLISYSAYLWHQPLFAFARHISIRPPGAEVFVLLCLLVLGLAWLTWRLVEAPFRDKSRFDRKRIFGLAAAVSAGFLVFGVLGHVQNGFERRFVRVLNGDVGHDAFHNYVERKFADCQPASIARQALRWDGFLRCKQTRAGAADMVLLGDSHAEHLFIGLAEAAPDRNVAFYILSGVPFVGDPAFKTIFAELLTNRRPQHVVITLHYVSRIGADGAQLHEGLSATIKALQAAGKTVSLVGDIPRYPKDPGYCAFAPPFGLSFSRTAYCQIPAAEAQAQRGLYDPILRRLSAEFGVVYVPIDAPLCSAQSCSMIKGDTVMYRDRNHLNINGSQFIGAYLARRLPS